ncbi:MULTISPECIES: GNAT family N-acetyltransferase [Brochothrix]|uniref:Acetyltransferase n=1 Tax=Brochothrix thermosphacta TaxID=2756 RepID=A0A1D2LL48_BROTH|nr:MULTISPECIES: GNAT family N-acetyltransferase [Brochothrix]ATF27157.1 N-acetyltransferase [Brochothrix thermosphacta]ATH86515.1 N-acetyltransferase [Brochothrix thermosphacta]EUJ34337.1 acetyltransferase [Brochothrix thermosphacta DSM 20171 = FSL F6-1036]MBR5525469.1 GNAT family N-acetyltransferase [Brochothrix sp.]MPQ28436.1 N-acetyltransferase [Brochothrix thermosphacta]
MITTERLFLREMTTKDFTDLCLILQDDKVMTAYEGAFNDTEVSDWLAKQQRNYRDHGIGLWAVILKENGRFIGQCGLTWQEVEGEHLLEVGYLFNADYWHQGFATEAAIACKKYAFKRLGADKVFSIIRDTNRASQAVALRNQMTPIKTIIKHYRQIDMPHTVYCVEKGGQ